LVISADVGFDVSILKAPAEPVVISSGPTATVAPDTGDPEGSMTFPNKVNVGSVVVVAGGTAVEVVKGPAPAAVVDTGWVGVGLATSTLAHDETTRASVARSARNRVGFTRAWYVSGPA
jgi:hypothetical protein